MADLMKKLKTGKLSALSQQTIQPFEDYEVTDVAEGGITNAQMTLALDESAGSFFKIGSVYLCIDEGTYTKHCFYKWNGVDASTPWEVVGSFDSKQDKLTAGANITINENNVISAGGGSQLYQHNISASVFRDGEINFTIVSEQSTAYTTNNSVANEIYNRYRLSYIMCSGMTKLLNKQNIVIGIRANSATGLYLRYYNLTDDTLSQGSFEITIISDTVTPL